MYTYISEFLRQGQDKENFVGSAKTYFSPWWKLWDRKIKTEKTPSGDMIREFDEQGNIIRLKRKRSTLHPRGFGSQYHWEELDLKTMTVTSNPYPNVTKKIFRDNRYEEIYAPQKNGIQKIVLGFIDASGELTPHAHLFLKKGKQVDVKWVKNDLRNKDFWKRVVNAYPLSLEEKADLLEKASQKFRKGKKVPETESELRAFKHGEERARLTAHKESYRETAIKEKNQEWARRYAARHGANK